MVRESLMDNLTLEKYNIAKREQCSRKHKACSKCSSVVGASRCVLENKFVALPYLWNKYFNGQYDSGKAQRKILQMPVAAISVNGKLFIVEKDHVCNTYEDMKTKINIYLEDNSSQKEKDYLPRKDYEELISLSESTSQQQILKHTICNAYNMSKRAGSRVYGIANLKNRAEAVKDAASIVAEIKQKHKKAMRIEQQTLLNSCGLDPSECLSSASSSESESSDDSEISLDSESSNSETSLQENEVEADQQTLPSNKAHVEAHSLIALEKLRQANFNWFVFVSLMEEIFKQSGCSSEMLNQFLDNFSSKLNALSLSEEEVKLTQASRNVYLDKIQEMEENSINVPDCTESSDGESSSDEDESANDSIASEKTRYIVKSELNKIRDRFRKKMTKEIQLNRLLRKKITWSSKTILNQFPDIGQVIETIVEESDVGADRWRRTGVYTFSGNPKESKRMTFGKIKQELELHYGRKFSYGTVVQLCVPRHKGRLSSKRYKSVANVKYQRA